jgi:chromosome segregation ATPase
MNVSNDTPVLNYVEYFTKQLPIDLANMASLRDELAVRQGALSAAQDAIADRAKATTELATAKTQADEMIASAKDKEDKAKVKLADLKTREDALANSIKAFDLDSANRETALSIREKATDTCEKRQQQTQANLDAKEAKLIADQSALDARIKAFQDNVAALKA